MKIAGRFKMLALLVKFFQLVSINNSSPIVPVLL
jgi:hypothetical protein